MIKSEDIIVSGIRATGNLHLGNYLGAISQFVRMQEDYKCFFFIADYHSLTTHPSPIDLPIHVRSVLIEYLASGLDPEKATIYLQSSVPQVTELYLILNMFAYQGELEKVPAFKEKSRKQPENVNAGLLTYPVLMAADILIHKGTKVPVGKDQEQHLEMVKHFARRFNNLYKDDFFPEPDAFSYTQNFVKIPGLNGTGKMGKSEGEGNAIFLKDEPKEIEKKIMRAVTDTGPTVPNQPVSEPVNNLFTIMKFVSTEDTCKYFLDSYNNCSIKYGELKKQLASDTISFLAPVRERIKEISGDDVLLKKVIRLGAEKAIESANKTLIEVRKYIGFFE